MRSALLALCVALALLPTTPAIDCHTGHASTDAEPTTATSSCDAATCSTSTQFAGSGAVQMHYRCGHCQTTIGKCTREGATIICCCKGDLCTADLGVRRGTKMMVVANRAGDNSVYQQGVYIKEAREWVEPPKTEPATTAAAMDEMPSAATVLLVGGSVLMAWLIN